MKCKLYQTPQDFLEDNRGFLLKYEAAVQLNLGNAQSHCGEACRPGLLFGRYEEQGEPLLLFGNTLPWNLCLNAVPGETHAPAAATELAKHLKQSGIVIHGLNARKDLCEAFLPAYGGTFHMRTGMDVMVLEVLIEPPRAPGHVRKAVPAELGMLTEWGLAFQREAVHESPSEKEIQEKFSQYVEKETVYLFEQPDGTAVSLAASNRALPHGAGISWVYTPPEHRGHGYAQCTVAEICREKLAEGKKYCTLFVDKANPISNKIYQKIGFQILEDCFDYKLNEEDGV